MARLKLADHCNFMYLSWTLFTPVKGRVKELGLLHEKRIEREKDDIKGKGTRDEK